MKLNLVNLISTWKSLRLRLALRDKFLFVRTVSIFLPFLVVEQDEKAYVWSYHTSAISGRMSPELIATYGVPYYQSK